MSNPFPVGLPELIVNGAELDKMSIKEDQMTYKGQPITGLIRLSILPPYALYPFLIQRVENKVYGACCNRCLKDKNPNPCRHSARARMITDVYTIPEITFAVSKCGYRIIKIYEVLAYR